MPRLSIKQESLSLISAVLAKLADDQPIRQELPGGGRLRFDRRLPFICVYRRHTDDDDAAEQLLESESASLVLPANPRGAKIGGTLLHAIVENLATHFGSFLVLELWTDDEPLQTQTPQRNGHLTREPKFEMFVPKQRTPRRTVEALAKSLSKVRLLRGKAQVTITHRDAPAPPGAKPLIRPVEIDEWNSYVLGLAIRPIYQNPKTGEAFSSVVRSLRRSLSTALKHAFFTFAHRRARIRPAHYTALGLESIGRNVFAIDHQLAAIGRSFDLLLQATPVNAEGAWHEFRRSRFTERPVFYYRPLTLDPMLLKRQLYAIQVERVEDPTLAYLFRQKQDELDRQITLLTDVDTPRFMPESLQIYGGVSNWLLAQAQELLKELSSAGGEDSVRGQFTATDFAARAEEEFQYYRKQFPSFTAKASVREDMFTGLMVSADQLLIGGKLRIPKGRVDALLQHEVGTHLVTRFNGRQQSIKQLEVGLAGYDGLQEGLAVLAEFLVGGLSRLRIRILAARVIAARRMVDGASFIETFRMLDRDYEFSQRTAYTIAMRTYRGGGLTKDAVYLRGLLQILKHLREGGELEPLYIGKIASAHLPLVAELRLRQVIKPPALRPRYLDDPAAQEKIARLRKGLTVLQLLES